jgi:hypothetical protein
LTIEEKALEVDKGNRQGLRSTLAILIAIGRRRGTKRGKGRAKSSLLGAECSFYLAVRKRS